VSTEAEAEVLFAAKRLGGAKEAWTQTYFARRMTGQNVSDSEAAADEEWIARIIEAEALLVIAKSRLSGGISDAHPG